MDKKKVILFRIYILYFAFCIVGVAILYKIFEIQIIEGDKWRAKAKDLSTELRKIEASRGNILAADGSFLAISVPTYELRMDTKSEPVTDKIFNEQIDSLAICLAGIFKDKSAETYKKEIVKARKEKNRYYLIKNNVSYSQLKKVRSFPIFRLGRYKGGLIPIRHDKRIKPYGKFASRTIGKPEDESVGLGIEKAYDTYLKGEEGLRLMEKLASGTWRPVDNKNAVDPVDGFDVITTIDPTIQDVAESELERQLQTHGADHGCVVLMEVETGDIKAIANLKKGENDAYYEGYNYAIGESVEPGSTFKLATMIALLEDGFVHIDDTIDTGNGIIKFYNHTLRDSKEGGHGRITVGHSFEVSSNIAMAKLVYANYKGDPERFLKHLRNMKLHEPLGIEIPGEGMPLIKDKSRKDWSGLTLPMMSIGYESRLTPLQILALYNAVANNGTLVKPRFVTEIRNRGAIVKRIEPTILKQSICSEKTIKTVQSILEGVVMRGTAANLKGSMYPIAGKTGTAQIANNGQGYVSDGAKTYRASFCGYFPADKPKYSCIVVITAPSKGVYYGNIVAGSIFKAVSDKVYASSFEINQTHYAQESEKLKYRLPKSKGGYIEDVSTVLNKLNITHPSTQAITWGSIRPEGNQLKVIPKTIQDNRMPDLRGMGARDAIFLLERMGLQAKLNGKGIVKNQSIEPGAPLVSVYQVYLELGS